MLNAESSGRKRIPPGLRRNLLSGLLVLVPLGISVFVLKLIFDMTVGMLVPLLRLVLPDLPYSVVALLSLVILLFVLYVAGALASHVVGRRLIAFGEWLVSQIPLVKTVYSVSKQVITLFLRDQAAEGRQVVLVEFPGPGLNALGFVTGRIAGPDGRDYYKVFIPTTPNPTSGFLEMIPVETGRILDLSAEEAVTLIMSGGFLGPEGLNLMANKPKDAPPAEGN